MLSSPSLETVLVPLAEIRRPLPQDERPLETATLVAIGRHFATSTASPRETYDTMIAQTPIADGISLAAVEDGDVRGWWVRPAGAPADRAILFLHGGAYVLGSAEAYRGFASQLAARMGVSAFVPDYPLAPEHPFPAAYEASVAAWRWLGTQGVQRVVLAGDSAGGGLALAALAEPADRAPAVHAAIVFSPWIDLALSGASFTNPETYDPIFKPAILAGGAAAYLGSSDPRDGRASPLYAVPDKLPPLLIQVGADELLLDDARRYAAFARKRGGAVRLDVFEGLHHVFQRSVELPAARRALDDAATFLSSHWA